MSGSISQGQSEQLELLKRLQEQGQAGGLVAKFAGYGVLVICLPVYGEGEQMLLGDRRDKGEGARSEKG